MGNVQTAGAVPQALWRQAPIGELVDLGQIYRGPLALLRLQSTPKRILSRREAVLLGLFALALHGAVIYWVSQSPTTVETPSSIGAPAVFADCRVKPLLPSAMACRPVPSSKAFRPCSGVY